MTIAVAITALRLRLAGVLAAVAGNLRSGAMQHLGPRHGRRAVEQSMADDDRFEPLLDLAVTQVPQFLDDVFQGVAARIFVEFSSGRGEDRDLRFISYRPTPGKRPSDSRLKKRLIP